MKTRRGSDRTCPHTWNARRWPCSSSSCCLSVSYLRPLSTVARTGMARPHAPGPELALPRTVKALHLVELPVQRVKVRARDGREARQELAERRVRARCPWPRRTRLRLCCNWRPRRPVVRGRMARAQNAARGGPRHPPAEARGRTCGLAWRTVAAREKRGGCQRRARAGVKVCGSRRSGRDAATFVICWVARVGC